ncbi:Enoyl-[Datura stramonium]|uniref:Enoyl-[acyl-carrier-protein] reductase [NADPH, B-specific] 2, mitochondrial n=1 Tax=Datura stramonium TaxID=4076 RepID=A0ABS8UJT1_DATST|nr:Enoyl-[acyl-carrier-protein] reductase [NADPH, B-specific] 2, mitochondrial [Datura stramonium]
MLKTVTSGFLILSFLVSVSEADGGFIQCNCDSDERYWSMERILTYQRISDFFIAVAYSSIPIEIIYFPTPLHLVHAILVSKFLTAVVSVFTACTLPSDIPLLLKVKNCAIWMTNENNTEMNLTHELTERNFSSIYNMPIPINDSDVKEIKGSDAVKILDAYSSLAAASSGGSCEPGAVAAIRMPLLRLSNFKGGTPELAPQSYPILVLVLPSGKGRSWSNQEIEIVRVVADQVAVALSHAAVLEES